MANDDAVRNQKAFIRMQAVLELQKRYLLTVQEEWNTRPDVGVSPGSTNQCLQERRRTLEQVIELLELPIATLG
jgi:hypothetical protein